MKRGTGVKRSALLLAFLFAFALVVGGLPAEAHADEAHAEALTAQVQETPDTTGAPDEGAQAHDEELSASEDLADDGAADVSEEEQMQPLDAPSPGAEQDLEGDQDSALALVPAEEERAASIEYRGHVQNIGWQDYVHDGAVAGTSGMGLRVEALNIRLVPGSEVLEGGVRYRMHVQNIGWQDWVADDAVAGTSGRALRLEAMRIELTGDYAARYDVYYRVHAQNIGWMGWAANGAPAGTAGRSLRLEAMQILLVDKGGAAPSAEGSVMAEGYLGGDGISVQAHVQNIGWQDRVGNGGIAGTTGRSLRVEALKISLSGLEVGGGVRAQAHVQNIGWQDWVEGGQVVGTTGRGLRVEALRLELTGEAADFYDLYYRVHVQNIGWMGWAGEGMEAGTAGMGARVEAVQVQLVREGQGAPGSTEEPFITGAGILTAAHIQNVGWMGQVGSGGVAGLPDKGLRMEAFNAVLSGGTLAGDVSYAAYVADQGWQGWVSNGAQAGTTGQGRAVEAVQMSLGGRVGSLYNVWYRVFVADVGWLGWARDGATAGAAGTGHSVQAIQVCLSPKFSNAPGDTEKASIDKSFFDDPMTKKAQGYASSTNWLILVDCSLNRVGIYSGSRGSWQRSDLVTVSTGAIGRQTVKGVFTVADRGYSFGGVDNGRAYTCYYWTQFYGPYLFHSVLYDAGTLNVQDGRLGENISHGCVRMPIEKAKWIYDNIPSGTTVVTY